MEASASSSALQCQPYPAPLARYEDVMTDSNQFMHTLKTLHDTMGTKFTIPIVGGKELDLHLLFGEVTLRGGHEKIIRERKWKEVASIFRYPASATNASYMLRKYYGLLLHHYEQIYFFKARNFIPMALDASVRSYLPSSSPVLQQGWTRTTLPPPEGQTPPCNQLNSADVGSSTECPLIFGVVDGKMDRGYLITVTIGSEKLKGVLYQPQQNRQDDSTSQTLQQGTVTAPSILGNTTEVLLNVQRRKRRKKYEIRRRDPDHPKPKRSGYNFFFSEQHARLKPLYPGKDREMSRIIGELWKDTKEDDRKVYLEKAMEDKERYRMEMECYRHRERTGHVISYAVPIQQRPLETDTEMIRDPDDESSTGSESIVDESESLFPIRTADTDEEVSEFQNRVHSYGNVGTSNFTTEMEMMDKLVGIELESNEKEGMELELNERQ